MNGHHHYSSSSESESEPESTPIQESHPEKELDANGNEVISTSNDVWKTNIEVEHTENEKMDDFINQLFMCSVCFNPTQSKMTTIQINQMLNYDEGQLYY